MKYYDKYLTPVSKDIQQTALILIVFIVGFVAGYFTANLERKVNEDNVTNQNQVQKIAYETTYRDLV